MSIWKKLWDRFFKTPEILGQHGESEISSKLSWVDFWGYHGYALRNLYIPMGNGNTTEIDLVYVTQKGIFVIESKNYSGYIFGSEHSSQWVSTLYARKNWLGQKQVEKYHFYNPVWQNRTHIRSLEKILGQTVPMFSLIVFSNHCELKKVEVSSPNVTVCQQSTFSHSFKSIWNSQEDVLTDSQAEALYQRLLPSTMADQAVKEAHKNDIRRRLDSTEYCPRCGGRLVLRTARKGPYAGQNFYGCSNYPKCRYIKNI